MVSREGLNEVELRVSILTAPISKPYVIENSSKPFQHKKSMNPVNPNSINCINPNSPSDPSSLNKCNNPWAPTILLILLKEALSLALSVSESANPFEMHQVGLNYETALV